MSRYITWTIQDSAIVTMGGEQELVCDPSNGAISNDLVHNPVFKVTPLFDAKYLTNDYRYGHSYYRRRIGNITQSFEWHQF